MSMTSVLSVEAIRQAIAALKTALPKVRFSTLVKPVPASLTLSQNNSRSKMETPTVRLVQDTRFERGLDLATHDVCSHLRRAIPRIEVDRVIRFFVAELKVFEQIHGAFDTFAFCGMSGALIAPLLAHLLEKELLM